MNADLLETLTETTLATSVAALLVLAVRGPLLAKFGASIAYAAWGLVPVAFAAVLLPAPKLAVVPMAMTGHAGAMRPAAMLQYHAPLPWREAVLATWALGAFATAALFWLQQRRFQRSLAGSVERDDGLRVANRAEGLPAVVGVLRPEIVLPSDFESRYSATERELILCHERIHVARCDLQANAVAAALRALFWFNPLLHRAARRFRRDQELACDERVVARHPQQRRSYADAMLKTQMAASSLPLGCQWQDSTPLKERIAMLKEHAPKPMRSVVGAAIVSLLFAAGGYAAWAAQPAKTVPAAHVDVASKSLNPPVYPVDAAKNGVNGKVVLIVDVGADGSVAAVKIDKSEPSGVFDEAVLAAVKKWKFVPATDNGKPVAGRVRIPVWFTTGEPRDDAKVKG